MPIDPSATIAPTAKVHPDAIVGPQCVIGEYCIVEQDVALGRGNRLEPYVYLKRWTSMGDENAISACTALGTDPFDKSFTGERSYLKIGHRNIIRENYTISRGTQPESETILGDDNYIMSSGHVAHNSRVGNGCTIASCSLVAGHVTIEDRAFISGGVVVHQFSRIGALAMIGGNVRVNQDALPYCLYSDFNITPKGLNLVGLRRAGIARDTIASLKLAYKILFHSHLKLSHALERIEREIPNDHTLHMVEFIRASKRGIPRPRRAGANEDQE
ncbi:MAG TPA: acyl-ACP--UDP-N-acetylglucosamine O-acyltransferase [Bryobacteraceae bacterium]|nr:acyl-ACP--UDP-N-acetylglucosamine O-acyltransferase [Bryobacteraceae bacterium]